ncbi:MAG: hypothetical protein WCF24_11575 [Acidimicrobiales bacterium]
MEIIPKAIIAGLFRGGVGAVTATAAPQMPGGGTIGRDVINSIWADVVKQYPTYQSLQFDPSGRGGAFVGEAGPDDLVLIQPPLMQVRTPVTELGVSHTADKVAFVFKTALFYFSGPPAVNLGVKLVCYAPSPAGDAIAFIRSEIIKGEEDYQILAGQMPYRANLNVDMQGEGQTYVLNVQPLHADNKMLYLDIDIQTPGLVDEQSIAAKILYAHEFMTTHVGNFLDKKAEGWSR